MGLVVRGKWYYETSARVIPVTVSKASVEVTVRRSYSYSDGVIDKAQMLADERVLAHAMALVDTAAGFHPVTSTAFAHN